jgi:spermidine/putrescine transport system permease protein
MLGNVIADQLSKSRDWPRSAAISMVFTLVTTAGVLLMMNVQKREASQALPALAAGEKAETGGRRRSL